MSMSAFGVEHTVYKAAPGSPFKAMENAGKLRNKLTAKGARSPNGQAAMKWFSAADRAGRVTTKAGGRVVRMSNRRKPLP